MKRRAAEVAAIKLCKSFVDNKPPPITSSRVSRSLSADKTQDNKDKSFSGDKTRNEKDRPSSTDKTHEKKDDVKTRGRLGANRTSAGSEDSNRRSSLRSNQSDTLPDSRRVTKKPDAIKKNNTSTRRSVSSSETDTDSNGSTDTEVSVPTKQRKIGIITCVVV